jgi:putative ABC transport system permease protein
MTFNDTISLSMRNLRQSILRTALTTLGVSIGIASLAGMVSLGVGLQDQVIGRFLSSGVFDAITVTSPGVLGPAGAALAGERGRGGRGGRGAGANSANAPKLTDESIKQISGMENVREVYPTLIVPVELKLGEFSRTLMVGGVPMSSKGEGVFQTITHGSFFSNDSDPACMLSLDMAKEIAEQNPASLIGQTPTLSYAARGEGDAASPFGFQVRRVEMQCRIVGIVERNAATLAIGGGPPVPAMIPIGLAKTIDANVVALNPQSLLRDPSQPKTYAAVTVKVKQAKFTQDVEDKIRQMGYPAFSINDALKGAKNAFIVIDILLSLIGSIALAVSSLGIVNTMVMSILERTREIGIMKAIGASNEHIRRIFLIEASVIGLLGGLLGTTLGWLVGKVINFGANIYIRSQGGPPGTFFVLPLWLIAGAIAFAVVVSLIAGSYPAARAANLDPIQALRHD